MQQVSIVVSQVQGKVQELAREEGGRWSGRIVIAYLNIRVTHVRGEWYHACITHSYVRAVT